MFYIIMKFLVSALIPGIILAYINKKIGSRGPKLVYYVSAATYFPRIVTPPSAPPQDMHVITIAIRNNGNVVAKNVDICHLIWPLHFQIAPFIVNQIIPIENPKIIRISSINPGETVWISYLFDIFVAPDVFIEYVRSEEVMGTRTNMLLNPVVPLNTIKLFNLLLIFGLFFIGVSVWWLYPPISIALQWIINYQR
jgi:hypothetical protein